MLESYETLYVNFNMDNKTTYINLYGFSLFILT